MGERGPPLKFETPAALAKAIDSYFAGVTMDEITQSGLCLHINLGKDSLIRYGKMEGYDEVIMMAKLRIENAYETALREKGGAGNIFALKNFGWIDKQEHEHSGSSSNPLITKIVREIVNVKQIEHAPPPPLTPEEITGDPNDDLSAGYNLPVIAKRRRRTTVKDITGGTKDDLSVDSGLPAGLDDLADEYDDFLQ